MTSTDHCLPWCNNHLSTGEELCRKTIVVYSKDSESEGLTPEVLALRQALPEGGLGNGADTLIAEISYDHDMANDPEQELPPLWFNFESWALDKKGSDEPLSVVEGSIEELEAIHAHIGELIRAARASATGE